MKNILLFILSTLVLVSCGNDSGGGEPETPVTPRRTIMVYFNAESSNIGSEAAKDFAEIVSGSSKLSEDCNLLVFYDNYTTSGSKQNSCIYKCSKGVKTLIKDYGSDMNASDPDVILDAFKFMIENYPAPEYVTVFWGHGTGPYISNKVLQTSSAKGGSVSSAITAYGTDCGSGITWINIPKMAEVLSEVKTLIGNKKQKMIMFDACMMQSVEVAYELKDYADYLVGACCETPGFGANYTTLIPVLDITPAETLAQKTIEDYCGSNNAWGVSPYNFFHNVVMSAVKTDELEDFLIATKKALNTVTSTTFPPMLKTTFDTDDKNADHCIYYYNTVSELDSRYTSEKPIFHDLKDIMRINLSTQDFKTWNDALEKTVLYTNIPPDIRVSPYLPSWFGGYIGVQYCSALQRTDFLSFYICKERCGGISMFIPNTDTTDPMNSNYSQYQWWQNLMP